jgi:hypothetical protein
MQPSPDRLAFLVELCNYDQPTFTPGQPEMVTQWLFFEGVRNVQAKPTLTDIRWGKGVDGEFVEVSEENPGRIKMVLKIDDYAAKSRSMLVLRFDATGVRWEELTESQRAQLKRGK